MRDIVFPNNNEAQFIKMAELLGYSKLVFVYAHRNDSDFSSSKIKIEKAILSKPSDANRSNGTIIVESSEIDRQMFESKRVSMIFNLENQKRDSMHYRNSGLNQVLCKLANKNNIKIGVALSNLLRAEDMLLSQLLGRIMQNIVLCRKYKVDIALASFAHVPYEMRAPRDIISLGICLGMHQSDAKRAVFN